MSLEIWSVMLLDRSLQLLWIAPVAWLLERSVLRRAGLRVRGVLWGLVLLRTLLPVELHAWFEAPASLRVVSGNGSSSLWWFALIHVVGVVAIGTAGFLTSHGVDPEPLSATADKLRRTGASSGPGS